MQTLAYSAAIFQSSATTYRRKMKTSTQSFQKFNTVHQSYKVHFIKRLFHHHQVTYIYIPRTYIPTLIRKLSLTENIYEIFGDELWIVCECEHSLLCTTYIAFWCVALREYNAFSQSNTWEIPLRVCWKIHFYIRAIRSQIFHQKMSKASAQLLRSYHFFFV